MFLYVIRREPTVKPQAPEGGDSGAKLPCRRGGGESGFGHKGGAWKPLSLSPTTPPFFILL
jgi:hypothetical protein